MIKQSAAQNIGRAGERWFQSILPKEWIFQKPEEDIGLDGETIRHASSPDDIADELSWAWCYYAPRGALLDHNMDEIDVWKKEHPTWREEHPVQAFPPLESQLLDLWSSPHCEKMVGTLVQREI